MLYLRFLNSKKVRYLLVGSANTAISYSIFLAAFAILPLQSGYRFIVSLLISFILSTYLSYCLQGRFVWKTHLFSQKSVSNSTTFGPSYDKYLAFFLFNLIVILICTLIAHTIYSVCRIDTRFIQLCLTPLVAVLGFYGNRIIFEKS